MKCEKRIDYFNLKVINKSCQIINLILCSMAAIQNEKVRQLIFFVCGMAAYQKPCLSCLCAGSSNFARVVSHMKKFLYLKKLLRIWQN